MDNIHFIVRNKSINSIIPYVEYGIDLTKTTMNLSPFTPLVSKGPVYYHHVLSELLTQDWLSREIPLLVNNFPVKPLCTDSEGHVNLTYDYPRIKGCIYDDQLNKIIPTEVAEWYITKTTTEGVELILITPEEWFLEIATKTLDDYMSVQLLNHLQ